MYLEGLIEEIEGAVRSQVALAGSDPAVESATNIVLMAMRPALRQAAFAMAEQAALEVTAQLPAHEVTVVLADGEPTMRVSETAGSDRLPGEDEDLSARITLRLPPSVKSLVEEAAGGTGASVNQWVVDALSKGARSMRGRGKSETGTIDL